MASAGPTVIASIAYSVVATIVFAATQYFATNLRRTWLIVGLAGLLVSFIPLLGLLSQDDASGTGVAILVLMHLVSAAIFIPTMLRLAGE